MHRVARDIEGIVCVCCVQFLYTLYHVCYIFRWETGQATGYELPHATKESVLPSPLPMGLIGTCINVLDKAFTTKNLNNTPTRKSVQSKRIAPVIVDVVPGRTHTWPMPSVVCTFRN